MGEMLIELFKTQLVNFGFYLSSIFPVLQSAGNIVVTCDAPGSPGLGSAPPISCCHYTNCLQADSQHFISSIHPESIPLEYLNWTNILIFRPIQLYTPEIRNLYQPHVMVTRENLLHGDTL